MGSALDWVMTDLINDKARLDKLPPGGFPLLTFNMKLKGTSLTLPFGTLDLDPSTEVRLTYGVVRTKDPETGNFKYDLNLNLKIKSAHLKNVNFDFDGRPLTAKTLDADEITINLGSLQNDFDQSLRSVEMTGIHATEMDFSSANHEGYGLHIQDGSIESLSASIDEKSWKFELGEKAAIAAEKRKRLKESQNPGSKVADTKLADTKGVTASAQKTKEITSTGVVITTPYGTVTVDKGNIPAILVYHSSDTEGVRNFIRVPEISSEGKLSLNPTFDSQTHLDTEGSSTIHDLDISTITNFTKGTTETFANLAFSGRVTSAKVDYKNFGKIHFSSELAKIEASGKPHIPDTLEPISGTLSAHQILPLVKEQVLELDPDDDWMCHTVQEKEKAGRAIVPKNEFSLELDVPHFFFHTEDSRMQIPEKSSAIKSGKLKITEKEFKFFGQFDIHDASFQGLSPLPTLIGNVILAPDTPKISDLHISGPAEIRFSNDKKKSQWGIYRHEIFNNKGASLYNDPVEIHYDIEALKITHKTENDETSPKPATTSTLQASVDVSDLQAITFTKTNDKSQLTELRSGRMMVYDIHSSARLWLNFPIWGPLMGSFPITGNKTPKALTTTDRSFRSRWDSSVLLASFSEDVRKKLGSADFITVDGIDFKVETTGAWRNHIDNLNIYLNEEGGREQFAWIKIPDFKASGVGESFTIDDTQKEGWWFLSYFYEPDFAAGSSAYQAHWPLKPGETL